MNESINNTISIIGKPFIELIETASTNTYAIDMIHAKIATHGTAIFAYNQTAGRGQKGREWLTETSSNIILSCILETGFISISQQFRLSISIALACRDFFSSYSQNETFIKWPNDIYCYDKKAAGVLIENIVRGQQWHWGIAGIGMNINQTIFDPSLKNATSLKLITGNDYNVLTLAKELCGFLEKRYLELKNGGNAKQLEEYNSHLYKINQKVTLKKANASFQCTVKGVNEYGQLMVSSASQDTFSFGEVEWVVP